MHMRCFARFGTNYTIEISTPPWVFFSFLKLFKWYQILQRITYDNKPQAVCLLLIRGVAKSMVFVFSLAAKLVAEIS